MSVDSETHDQEWAMVNTVGRRSHNSGGKFSVVPFNSFNKIAAHSVCKMCHSLVHLLITTLLLA